MHIRSYYDITLKQPDFVRELNTQIDELPNKIPLTKYIENDQRFVHDSGSDAFFRKSHRSFVEILFQSVYSLIYMRL